MTKSIFLFISLISFVGFTQTVNYNDVAVIVNSNSQTSIDIATYFQNARNVPNQNMIYISAPTSEDIDSATFQGIRTQIEDYLTNNNLVDSINYLVTTKGIPLKVVNSCFFDPNSNISCASFDSELCLILGSNSSAIGEGNGIPNPVFEQTQHFSKSAYDMYLVTRLTGYSKQDVYDLIDRSGPDTGINQLSAQSILDINNSVGGDSSYFHDLFVTPTEDYLSLNSWNSLIHPDTLPSQDEENVFAYIFFGSGSSFNVDLNHTWTNGSVGAISTCYGAETFEPSSNTSNQLLLGNLIAEGCTGAHGVVNCNYFGLIFRSDVFFQRYLDQTDNYNLAESFYMAEPRMSWQAVVIGDPKASVVVDNLAEIDDPEELDLRLYPNPTNGIIHIASDEIISSIQVYGTNGALVKSIESIANSTVNVDINDLNPGMYLVNIACGDRVKVERVVLTE